MTAEQDIAAIDDGGANTAAEVRTALTSVLGRADSYERLDQIVVGAGGVATISFTPIAGGHESLKVVLTGRSARAMVEDTARLRLNNDSGANYDYFSLLNASGSASNGQTSAIFGLIPGTSTTGGVGQSEILIGGYARTVFEKSVAAYTISHDNTNAKIRQLGIMWHDTSAVTRVDFFLDSGDNWVEGTVATLYGIE